MSSNNGKQSAVDFVERVRVNQRKLSSGLKAITTSSSVGRLLWLGGGAPLGRESDVSVLLLRSRQDDVPSVTEAARWFENLGPSAMELCRPA